MNLYNTLRAIIFVALSTTTLSAQSELEMKLFELPDVIFTKIDAPKGYESAYKLMIKQPLDHGDISKGHLPKSVAQP